VPLTGIGIAPVAGVSPASLDFGSVRMGTLSTPQVVTLSNTGTAPLLNIGITVPLGDFSISANTCGASLAEGLTCDISITFAPTFMGAVAADLTITSNDPNNPVITVPLDGIGIQPVAAVSPASVAFGNQIVNSPSTSQIVTFSNTGNMTMTISGITLSGADAAEYSISNNTCGATLNAGSNCTMSITFTPTVSGAAAAQLNIVSDAVNTPTTVPINGMGTVVVVSTSSINFGEQLVITAGKAPKTLPIVVTLFNAGSVPLIFNSVAITGANAGDFLMKSKCKTSLSAGGSCSMSIRFAPLDRGARVATLTISSSDTASPQLVTLNGTGRLGPVADLSPASLAFGNVPILTTSAPQSITLTNTGEMPLIISCDPRHEGRSLRRKASVD